MVADGADAGDAAKRPFTYDVMDSWKSIQGTRLSDDGQWLAYATSAQSEDGELVVSNVRSGQEFKHARGTVPPSRRTASSWSSRSRSPRRTRSARRRRTAGGTETPAAEAPAGRGGRGNARARTPRTGMGIMTLPDGQVKTFDKVGSFSLPDEIVRPGSPTTRVSAAAAVAADAAARADAAAPARRTPAARPPRRDAGGRRSGRRTRRGVAREAQGSRARI